MGAASCHAPMLGSRVPNAGYKTPSRRGYAKPRAWVGFERDNQRRFEQDLFAGELVGEFSPDPESAPGPITFLPAWPDEVILSDADAWEQERYLDEIDEDALHAEALEALARVKAQEDLARMARYSLDPEDLPGWGDEIQWSDLHHFTNRGFLAA